MESSVALPGAPVGPAVATALSAPSIQVAPQAPAKDKYAWIAKMTHGRVNILHVMDLDEYYYRPDGSPLFKRLADNQLVKWVRDLWVGAFASFTPKEIKDATEVVKIMTEQEIDSVNSNYIYICDGLYWDKRKGELTDGPIGPVFYKLFDTDFPDRHTVRVTPFTKEQRQALLNRYEQVKKELEIGRFEQRYEFIKVWANNDKDVATDLIRMNAYCFLDKKPLGSGILVGLKRNGKSTYVDMLHTEFGNNNTSRVQLTQLGDPHYTHTLRFSLLNAPDEEEEKAVQFQGLFKTMSDHGILTLPVMRSNVPVRVPCDFMSFFPMNHTPEWKGTGASACVSRSLIIPFDNDLSKYDKVSKNFCEETFTAEMFSDYLGTVFAYAWWYHRHDHEFSHRMTIEQSLIQEDLDSAVIYRKEFEKFFDGFDALKLVYEDYQFWCMARDTKISTYKQFRFVFKQYLDKRTKYYNRDKKINVYRVLDANNPGRRPILQDSYIPEVGSIDSLHNKSVSIVERLIDIYEDEFEMVKGYGGEQNALFD